MLHVYSDPVHGSPFSDDGSLSYPFSISTEAQEANVIIRKLFLRNDNSAHSYSGVSIQPVDGGDNIVDGNGYGWKLQSGDPEPSDGSWALISNGNSIPMSNISDTTTYLPFWVRVEVPEGESVKSFHKVTLEVTFTES